MNINTLPSINPGEDFRALYTNHLLEDEFPIAARTNSQNSVPTWMDFGMRLGVSSALHPFEYAKVLIQLGYEPIAPRPGRTIFGKPAMILPNILKYVNYIRKVDGIFGCYRGLTPKIIGNVLGSLGSERVAIKLGFAQSPAVSNRLLIPDDIYYEQFQQQLKRDVILHVSALVITQPFHVVSVRMMAEFVGGPSIYKTLRQSFREILQQEGWLGLWSGFVPKLLCDLACLVVSSTTIYLVNEYIICNKNQRQSMDSFFQFVCSSIMYPLQVVSTCMVVSGSRVKAGQPPHMPIYTSWTMCWRELYAAGEHKRGSSLFWRCYVPPSAVMKMVPFPVIKAVQ